MRSRVFPYLTSSFPGRDRLIPHPEERVSGVSKDEARATASWFETGFALLTVKV
jgi:hypothetical protein